MSNPAESSSHRRHTHHREHGGDVRKQQRWRFRQQTLAFISASASRGWNLATVWWVVTQLGSAIVVLHIFDCKWYKYMCVWIFMSIFMESRRRPGTSSVIHPSWTHFIESFVPCGLFSNYGWDFLQSCTRLKSSLLTEWEESGNVISTFNFLLF